jgi:hypothetical protein
LSNTFAKGIQNTDALGRRIASAAASLAPKARESPNQIAKLTKAGLFARL